MAGVERLRLLVPLHRLREVADQLLQGAERDRGIEAPQRVDVGRLGQPVARLRDVPLDGLRHAEVVDQPVVTRIHLEAAAQRADRPVDVARQQVDHALKDEDAGVVDLLARRLGDDRRRLGDVRGQYVRLGQLQPGEQSLLRGAAQVLRLAEARDRERAAVEVAVEQPELEPRGEVVRVLEDGRVEQLLGGAVEPDPPQHARAPRLESGGVDAGLLRLVVDRQLPLGVAAELADASLELPDRRVVALRVERQVDEVVGAGDRLLLVLRPPPEAGLRGRHEGRHVGVGAHLPLLQGDPVLDVVGEPIALSVRARREQRGARVLGLDPAPLPLGVDGLEADRVLSADELVLVVVQDVAVLAPADLRSDPVVGLLQGLLVDRGRRVGESPAEVDPGRAVAVDIAAAVAVAVPAGAGADVGHVGVDRARQGRAAVDRVARRRRGRKSDRSDGADLRDRRQVERHRLQRVPVLRRLEEVAAVELVARVGRRGEADVGRRRHRLHLDTPFAPGARRLVRAGDLHVPGEAERDRRRDEEALLAIHAHERPPVTVASGSMARPATTSFMRVRPNDRASLRSSSNSSTLR